MKNTNVRVDFRIIGEEFDIQMISKELGIAPTISWNKGDLIKNTKKAHTYTAWIFSTGVEETLDINSQLKKMEKIFYSKENILCVIRKKYNLEFCIDIVIVIENQSPPAIYLDKDIVHFASTIDARFDFDTYVNEDA